jgi:hypothetical protein
MIFKNPPELFEEGVAMFVGEEVGAHIC